MLGVVSRHRKARAGYVIERAPEAIAGLKGKRANRREGDTDAHQRRGHREGHDHRVRRRRGRQDRMAERVRTHHPPADEALQGRQDDRGGDLRRDASGTREEGAPRTKA